MAAGDFPPEIIFEILARLPPKDLLPYLCVSKSWNAIIHDQRFIKSHLQHSLENDSFRTFLFQRTPLFNDFCSLPFHDDGGLAGGSEEVLIQHPSKHPKEYTHILGHCNGLLCIRSSVDGGILLWNPSIQKFKEIPTTPTTVPSIFGYVSSFDMYGFGYDSVNDDYKIVKTAEFLDMYDLGVGNHVNVNVNVYSLKSNAWKTIQKLPYIGFQLNTAVDMVFLNGSIHWLMKNKIDLKKHIIVTLDLATDEYHEFPAPVDREDDDCRLKLQVLRGSLCIFVSDFSTRHDVWIMNGMTESWTLLFSVGQDRRVINRCQTLFISKKGEIALFNITVKTDINWLIWFDISKKSSKQVENCDLPLFFDATICSGSLLLLDADSVIVQRQDQSPSTSKKRKILTS